MLRSGGGGLSGPQKAVLERLSAAEVTFLAEAADALRKLLRIKVEDDADLVTARREHTGGTGSAGSVVHAGGPSGSHTKFPHKALAEGVHTVGVQDAPVWHAAPISTVSNKRAVPVRHIAPAPQPEAPSTWSDSSSPSHRQTSNRRVWLLPAAAALRGGGARPLNKRVAAKVRVRRGVSGGLARVRWTSQPSGFERRVAGDSSTVAE